jgi:hypothetical protein
MQKDKGYIEEATRRFGYVPEYVAGADANEEVRQILYVKPEVRTFMRGYIASRPQ